MTGILAVALIVVVIVAVIAVVHHLQPTSGQHVRPRGQDPEHAGFYEEGNRGPEEYREET